MVANIASIVRVLLKRDNVSSGAPKVHNHGVLRPLEAMAANSPCKMRMPKSTALGLMAPRDLLKRGGEVGEQLGCQPGARSLAPAYALLYSGLWSGVRWCWRTGGCRFVSDLVV